MALGETPNLAARLQGLAAPNTVVISAATHRLVQGYLRCEALGIHTAEGGRHAHTGLSGAGGKRGPESPGRGRTHRLTPLVGREQEVALLLERWAQSQGGLGQVVLLSGEAGIGKSRLVQVLASRWRTRAIAADAALFPLSYQQSALYPGDRAPAAALQWRQEATPAEARLAKLEQGCRRYGLPLEEVVPLLGRPLSGAPARRLSPLTLISQRQKQQTRKRSWLGCWQSGAAAGAGGVGRLALGRSVHAGAARLLLSIRAPPPACCCCSPFARISAHRGPPARM